MTIRWVGSIAIVNVAAEWTGQDGKQPGGGNLANWLEQI